MNRRINKCIDNYFKLFKEDVCKAKTADEMKHKIVTYPPLIIKPTDYEKKQRVKNIVPLYERCKAYRANKLQCTRRRRDKENFCGTHAKGTPHGIVDVTEEDNVMITEDVHIQEINGINYYIDDHNNVYDPQDVYQNKINPRRIHKYEEKNGEYIILNIS